MKTLKYILFGLFISSTLTSCFKEDEPVAPYISPEGVSTVVAETKPDYSLQTYYDFATNTFVSTNDREVWDLSFSCDAGVSAIYLNGAKKMRVFDTGTNDWSVAVNTSNPELEWVYDESSGEPENTALSSRQSDRVYLVDLGISTVGNPLGFRKIKFISSTEQSITFEYAAANGSDIKSITLTKDPDYNFVYFSYKNGGTIVTPEPKKSTYDLLFTQYTSKAYYEGSTTEFEWYSVNGVLLNPSDVSVAIDSTNNFQGITYDMLTSYQFSSVRDVIGYEWKIYNIDAATYTVLSQNTYLVKDRNAGFWKLRFTSFTNALGERGYPTFEVAKF